MNFPQLIIKYFIGIREKKNIKRIVFAWNVPFEACLADGWIIGITYWNKWE